MASSSVIDPATQIGRHCTESVENSRMHIVAQTGKAEINQSQFIKGQNMVVQRIPIKQDGRLIAVFGQVMFKDVKDVGKLARELSLLESKVKLYEEELVTLRSTRYTFDSIIGASDAIRSVKGEALKAAGNSFPVLITGESGTGKELFAQAIHHASARRLYPFVRINCAAIPRDLLESELFGYERGAFTGARTEGKPGKFELAHQGTIFLDEIGDLPVEMQPKLLRAIEDKEFERVGGTRVVRSDFRVIAATNQHLETLLASGRFRKDLFYRLNVIPLHIPPLRERRGDILFIMRQLPGADGTRGGFGENRDRPGGGARAALLRLARECAGTHQCARAQRFRPRRGYHSRGGPTLLHPARPEKHRAARADVPARASVPQRARGHLAGPERGRLPESARRPHPRNPPHPALQEDEEIQPAAAAIALTGC